MRIYHILLLCTIITHKEYFVSYFIIAKEMKLYQRY